VDLKGSGDRSATIATIIDALPIGIALFTSGGSDGMNRFMCQATAHDANLAAVIERAGASGEPLRAARLDTDRSAGFVFLDRLDAIRSLVLFVPLQFLGEFNTALAETTELYEDFREIFRSSFDGIFVADGTGSTLMVNEGCERNYDVAAAELVGKHVSEFEAKGWIRPAIAPRVIETRGRVSAVQRTHKGKTILVTGIPLFDSEGKVRKVIINSRDMTELIKLRHDLVAMRTDIERIESEVERLRTANRHIEGLVAKSNAMRQIVEIALRVAKVEATVLISGESGVGKEVIANLIHRESGRHRGPFIKVNCGAIPRELLESELFGYEAGAFTGAARKGKPGLIELAHRGTLFLDEIGELPLDLQVKLLHVIQDRCLMRVGATRAVELDIRIVAATNRNLRDMVAAKTFRTDLYYRLNVVPIEIPPLRCRREDIVPLAEHALGAFNVAYRCGKSIDRRVLSALSHYDWPGNVRELRNIVERLVVMSAADTIMMEDLAAHVPIASDKSDEALGLRKRVENFERALIADALTRFGSTRAAAQHLGISQPTLVRKMARPAS
jgi:PAS domain S-box-containing protein